MHPMVRRGATWTVIAAALIGGWEGLDLVAKPDTLAHGLPTVCYGMTPYDRPVQVGDRYTKDECLQFLVEALPVYDAPLEKCIHVPMSPSRRAAAVSLAYNIGPARVLSRSLSSI